MNDQTKTFLTVAPIVAAVGGAAYVSYRLFSGGSAETPINPIIRKDEKKVADQFDIEDLVKRLKPGEKVSLCRCWRSTKWPYCDGAHKQFNQKTGDNVGPVTIHRKREG